MVESDNVSAEDLRRAYLQALQIDVYVPRRRESAADAEEDEHHTPVAGADWEALRQSVAACTRCPLHQTRTQTVFGVGDPHADWMIIGEAPGQEEDRRGEPFVGKAGKLLDEMLQALGLDRTVVFIANILKCRPPGNRDPAADEAAACRGYLDRQIELVAPKIVLAVGRIAAQQLLSTDAALGSLRSKKYQLEDGTPLVVTYHPAYLLRSPTQKRKAWQDLVLARNILGETRA